MFELMAGRTAVWVTERAIQILGGYGYTREYPVGRMHRDSKIYDMFQGTEQIQQLVIARAISGLRIDWQEHHAGSAVQATCGVSAPCC
jgi:acyl-CoA dehydrogenase